MHEPSYGGCDCCSNHCLTVSKFFIVHLPLAWVSSYLPLPEVRCRCFFRSILARLALGGAWCRLLRLILLAFHVHAYELAPRVVSVPTLITSILLWHPCTDHIGSRFLSICCKYILSVNTRSPCILVVCCLLSINILTGRGSARLRPDPLLSPSLCRPPRASWEASLDPSVRAMGGGLRNPFLGLGERT